MPLQTSLAASYGSDRLALRDARVNAFPAGRASAITRTRFTMADRADSRPGAEGVAHV